MKKITTYTVRIALCVLLCYSLQSCYHYRIASAHYDPATTYHHKTVHSFFWGAVQKRTNGIDVVATNCDSLNIHSLDEVRVTTSFGYSLITVASLGIWSPVKIEWKCAKPCPREGDVP
ncbi:hypothetical protein [Xanthocytophaga agilis]|uniref:Lipoprotein n=1 Tax=Xanthocytophaga agilis TaxID=3048010 RepID=A0AAE3R3M4_9BACT|nr:hypothetical protein [Xanthocytophaga agilis]MDJ1500754.1 hypothetical protein [Xanthocytophaga agilis]